MQTPASLYRPTIRPLPDALTEIRHDERHIVRPVRRNGTIRWKSKKVFITEVPRLELIDLLRTPTGAFQVYFGQMYLGVLDAETATFNPNRGCLPDTHNRHEQNAISG